MPELPEVETIRRGLEKELKNAVIARFEVHDARLLSDQKVKNWRPQLMGQSLTHVHRVGKYLELILANRQRFFVHLRMTGQLLVLRPSDQAPVLWRMKITFTNGKIALFCRPAAFWGNLVVGAGCVRSITPTAWTGRAGSFTGCF